MEKEIFRRMGKDIRQKALDAAWASDNPECRLWQEKLFPNRKPTVDEFVAVIVQYARENYPTI